MIYELDISRGVNKILGEEYANYLKSEIQELVLFKHLEKLKNYHKVKIKIDKTYDCSGSDAVFVQVHIYRENKKFYIFFPIKEKYTNTIRYCDDNIGLFTYFILNYINYILLNY